jgi:arylsulfatase A-like enzyme
MLAEQFASPIKRSLDTGGTSSLVAIFGAMFTGVIFAKCYAVSHIPAIAREPYWLLMAAAFGFLCSFKELIICFLLFFASLTALALSRAKAIKKLIVAAFGTAAAIILFLNLASSELLYMFGSPLTLNMIVFSDVLGSDNGRVAVLSWLSPGLVAAICATSLTSIAILIALRSCLWGLRSAVLAVGAAAAVLVASGALNLFHPSASVYKASPVTEFARSVADFRTSPLSDIPVREAFKKGSWQPGLPRQALAEGKIRNVILIVVESAAAEYLEDYGGRYGATPHLTSLKETTLRVDNAYAQAVSSTLSMGVLLSARYPEITVKPDHPTKNMIGDVLQRGRVSTGFFHSSDTRYGKVDKMLAASGFDTIRDFRHRNCHDELIQDETEFNSQGNTDRCTFAEMAEWIARAGDRPFFGMLWTFQTHYPYFDLGRRSRISLGSELSHDPRARGAKLRYLNALLETDAQIGRLMNFLKQRKLLEETLVIVTGDHGEAFGQHGTFGHGFDLFEEGVRVPLLLINPAFNGMRYDRLTGHIDIAPTIADVLRLQSPPEWQGSSLFKPRQNYPVFFFSPCTDLMVGYRDGDRKVISRLFARQVSEYHLSEDPEELNDLLVGRTGDSAQALARIAGWARGAHTFNGTAVDSPSRLQQ